MSCKLSLSDKSCGCAVYPARIRLIFSLHTCMFHVLGRWTVVAVVAVTLWPFACFVCCMIWLIKSSCWRVNPSLFVVVAVNVVVPMGELGEGDFELIAVIVFPSPFIWYCMQVAPCGELASPTIFEYCDKDVRNWSSSRETMWRKEEKRIYRSLFKPRTSLI